MTRPVTVVQITSSSNRSGGTRQAALLSKCLVEAGHRVFVCAPEGSPALRWAAEGGAESQPLFFGNPWNQWKSSRRLRALVREVDADVVHAHHTKGHNVALLATFGGSFPPVVANRGVLFRPEFPTRYRSSRTAAIIANSESVKRVLVQSGVPGRKIQVIYNARHVPERDVPVARLEMLREELGLIGKGPVVGAVGSARPEKGFRFLVEAAPAILEEQPSAAFVLIGTGTDRFRPRLSELGVADRFRLPGYRPDAVEWMALFDVFVIPSVGMDSCPNVLLEAMGAGLPVVGTAVGGIGEIVSEGQTGRLVPPGDPRSVARAVLDLVSDIESAREMGERGRQRLAERFTWETKVRKTLEVYEEVLSR